MPKLLQMPCHEEDLAEYNANLIDSEDYRATEETQVGDVKSDILNKPKKLSEETNLSNLKV